MSKPIPHMTIGVVGPLNAGSTTLTSAITKVLSQSRSPLSVLFSSVLDTAYSNKYIPYERMRETRGKLRKNGIVVDVGQVRYVTPARVYECFDFGGEDYIKGLISGATPMTALILVLSATDIQPPFTALHKHLPFARQSGIKKLCIFINKIDLLQESSTSELPGNILEKELRALLTEYRYDGARTPIISGSALVALQVGDKRRGEIGEKRVGELIRAADSWFDVPSRAIDGPFLLPIEKITHIPGRGTIATGRVERGFVNTGNTVDIVGPSSIQHSKIKGVEIFHKLLDSGHAGEKIGCVLRGIKPETLELGQIIAVPGSVVTIKRFRALIYVLKQNEGGRADGISLTSQDAYRPRVMLRNSCVDATLEFPSPLKDQVNPGDYIEVGVDLERPLAVEMGVRFTLHEGSFITGCGIVSKVLQ